MTALLLFPTGTAGAGGSDAAQAVERHFGYLSDGQYGRLWRELHPAQQQLLPKQNYERCAAEVPSFEITDVEVTDTYPERITLPGTRRQVRSVAVTVRLTVVAADGEQRDTDTFHEVKVDHRWRWVLKDDPTLYRDGNCP